MSYVTDVILLSHYLDSWTVDKIHGYLNDHHDTMLNEISEYGGGNKVMQCFIHAGAFNYLDLEAFLNFLKTLPYEVRQLIQLLTSEEHDDKFTLQEI